MDKRTLIALLLALVILFGFQYFFAPKEPPAPPKEAAPAKEAPAKVELPAAKPSAPGGVKTEAPAPTAPVAKAIKTYSVDTPLLKVALSDLGGSITSVRLVKYKETLGSPQGKELFEDIVPYRQMPIIMEAQTGGTATDATLFTSDKGNVNVKDTPETITFTGALTNGKKVKKIYTFYPDRYTIGLRVVVENLDPERTYADLAMISMKEKPSYSFKGPFVYNGKSLDQVSNPDKGLDVNKSYTYAGFDEGYFAFIWIPEEASKPSLRIEEVNKTIPIERLKLDKPDVAGQFYFGPRDIEILKSLNIRAEKIVDFGWFDIVAKPMLWGMNWVNKYTHNYGIDIILLTILIKIIFYPLSLKSYKSMKEMQKLQPQIAKLREKYKNDREKLNQEMMGIYKQKGINPLGGCLPMVIQIPVFFALYKVLIGAIEFRHAPFMLWINDLASPEDLFSITVAGYTLPFRVLPLIMGITQVLQQKMTPTSADPMQEKMMLLMPIVFTFLFWGFPSGLVLYWLVNNVISIAQQMYINKKAK
ncbi:MAG TPA: membrane protein insertase YidC [Syntrophorhabdales bacterium]|nr:membrane protein insertase YidC [Syntrophorhabdales bacterium]